MQKTKNQIIRIIYFTALLLLVASVLMLSPRAVISPIAEKPLEANFEPLDMQICGLSSVECGQTARITKYGATGNPMANGAYPEIGWCATSDRTIPFGTEIIIPELDIECVVGDRTALWVHEKHGLTIDLYSEETHQEMLNFGAKQMEIITN